MQAAMVPAGESNNSETPQSEQQTENIGILECSYDELKEQAMVAEDGSIGFLRTPVNELYSIKGGERVLDHDREIEKVRLRLISLGVICS